MEYRLPLPQCLKSFWPGALLLLAAALPAQAKPENVSDGEIAMLPPYCQDAYWNGRSMNIERRKVWRARLGSSFEGLHHYCWALVQVQRASTLTAKNQRSFMLNSAVSDFMYSINNSVPDFVLLPEILYRMGEAYQSDDNITAALQSYESSRARKPDYWPSYLKAAEILERLKLRGKAVDLLREGLSHAPAEPALLERYKALGGKLPIEPAMPAASAATPETPASQPTS